jgi:hypothetical protein
MSLICSVSRGPKRNFLLLPIHPRFWSGSKWSHSSYLWGLEGCIQKFTIEQIGFFGATSANLQIPTVRNHSNITSLKNVSTLVTFSCGLQRESCKLFELISDLISVSLKSIFANWPNYTHSITGSRTYCLINRFNHLNFLACDLLHPTLNKGKMEIWLNYFAPFSVFGVSKLFPIPFRIYFEFPNDW